MIIHPTWAQHPVQSTPQMNHEDPAYIPEPELSQLQVRPRFYPEGFGSTHRSKTLPREYHRLLLYAFHGTLSA